MKDGKKKKISKNLNQIFFKIFNQLNLLYLNINKKNNFLFFLINFNIFYKNYFNKISFINFFFFKNY